MHEEKPGKRPQVCCTRKLACIYNAWLIIIFGTQLLLDASTSLPTLQAASNEMTVSGKSQHKNYLSSYPETCILCHQCLPTWNRWPSWVLKSRKYPCRNVKINKIEIKKYLNLGTNNNTKGKDCKFIQFTTFLYIYRITYFVLVIKRTQNN